MDRASADQVDQPLHDAPPEQILPRREQHQAEYQNEADAETVFLRPRPERPATHRLDRVEHEVAAIEDGYLNATARLNSSNSTLANLSVPGGSTLGAVKSTSLDVSGASPKRSNTGW